MNSFLGGVVTGLRQRSVVVLGNGRPLLQRRFALRLYHASSKRTTRTTAAKVSSPSTDAPQRPAEAASQTADSAVSCAGNTGAATAAAAPSPLPLDAAYRAMFTDAEREHLTFDLFLEDWEAFCEEEEGEEWEREREEEKKKKDHKHKPNDPRQWVGYETALRFLEANQ
mmetsp:Transcript_6406/g.18309  ORF Transcript_6406/g.18309 Transcript_6406/m.18309 type:complete len:169 (+) Transcript_6406:182-688(+)